MPDTLSANIREAAKEWVRANIEAEPAIVRAYLFPSDREIRLVYVDPTTSPLRSPGQIAPFYFGSNKLSDSFYASNTAAIALVLPEEAEKAQLPEGWGAWSEAEILWEKPQNSAKPGNSQNVYQRQISSHHAAGTCRISA